MKMKKEHFDHMKKEIDFFVNGAGGYKAVVEKYERGNFPNSDKVKDLHKRLCWDCVHYAGLTPYVCRELYTYLKDDHITTAIKAFIPKPIKRY